MEDLFEKIVELKRTGKPAALLIVTKTQGSVPRRAGAKMIVLQDGTTIGTLGGGDLEKKAIEEALEAIQEATPRIASFTLDIEKGKLDMMCGGELEVYIEPMLLEEKLIIFGAGHITRCLAPLMKMAGFNVSVVDDSPDLLRKEAFPETDDLILTDMEQYAKDLPSDHRTYVVLLSRGFSRDKEILSQLIRKDFKYIGMIGSMRKIRTMKEDLKKEGVPDEAFMKLQAPIGLDIGGETPEEIAISIAAEIIAVKKGKVETFKKKGVEKDVN
ncbi:MAG: XdhC family protein [Thermodesulfobacteriota bacterium]